MVVRIDKKKLLKTIGDTIREYKDMKGITVEELSIKAGVSDGVCSDLINCVGHVPSLDIFVKITKALDIPDKVMVRMFKGREVDVDNICTLQEVRGTLARYGVSKVHLPMMIKMVDTIAKSQRKSPL